MTISDCRTPSEMLMYPIVNQEKLGKVGTHQAKESNPQPSTLTYFTAQIRQVCIFEFADHFARNKIIEPLNTRLKFRFSSFRLESNISNQIKRI